MERCQYVTTQRGGIALVHKGHRYNKVRAGRDGTIYWRCAKNRLCPGRAVTVNDFIKKVSDKHTHPPIVSKDDASDGMFIVLDGADGVPDIVAETLKLPTTMFIKIPQSSSLRSKYFHSRTKHHKGMASI